MSIESVVRHWARDASILVVGDAMLDEYVLGEVRRVSPEAPVPVVEVENVTRRHGGAANVATILAGLGCRAQLVAVVGQDDEGELLKDMLRRDGVDVAAVVPLVSRRTTRKQRVVCRGQQMLRCDHERKYPLSAVEDAEVAQLAASLVGNHHGVLLSDYAKGVVTNATAVETINEARRQGIPVVVDPKGKEWSKYLGASVIKPNLHELEAMAGYRLQTDKEIETDAASIMRETGDMAVVLTRGAQGLSVIEAELPVRHFRTGQGQVRTVIGAGDVVAAVLALGLAAGANLADAASAANVMATAHCERGLQLE